MIFMITMSYSSIVTSSSNRMEGEVMDARPIVACVTYRLKNIFMFLYNVNLFGDLTFLFLPTNHEFTQILEGHIWFS